MSAASTGCLLCLQGSAFSSFLLSLSRAYPPSLSLVWSRYLDAMAAAPEEFKEFASCLDQYG